MQNKDRLLSAALTGVDWATGSDQTVTVTFKAIGLSDFERTMRDMSDRVLNAAIRQMVGQFPPSFDVERQLSIDAMMLYGRPLIVSLNEDPLFAGVIVRVRTPPPYMGALSLAEGTPEPFSAESFVTRLELHNSPHGVYHVLRDAVVDAVNDLKVFDDPGEATP